MRVESEYLFRWSSRERGAQASTLNEWYRLPLPLVHLPAGVRQLGEHVRALALGEWLKVSNPSVHKVRSLLALAT